MEFTGLGRSPYMSRPKSPGVEGGEGGEEEEL